MKCPPRDGGVEQKGRARDWNYGFEEQIKRKFKKVAVRRKVAFFVNDFSWTCHVAGEGGKKTCR